MASTLSTQSAHLTQRDERNAGPSIHPDELVVGTQARTGAGGVSPVRDRLEPSPVSGNPWRSPPAETLMSLSDVSSAG